MTNDELASALNSEFGLEGRARVSANVIRQWVDWGLLPKAQITGRSERGGPIWERKGIAMIRARRFAEMRAFGIQSPQRSHGSAVDTGARSPSQSSPVRQSRRDRQRGE